MGHKIRKAMADRGAYWKPSGLVETYKSYFVPSKPGKWTRGADGKINVVVVAEDRRNKADFVKIAPVQQLIGEEMPRGMGNEIEGGRTLMSGGFSSSLAFDSKAKVLETLGLGRGLEVAMLLPWVHPMIANAQESTRAAYHGVSSKHFRRFLAEVYYRPTRQPWGSRPSDHLPTASCHTSTT